MEEGPCALCLLGYNMACVVIKMQFKSRDIIISFLQKHGDCARIFIARETGLTKAAITQITNELIKEGVLIEKGEIQNASAEDAEENPQQPKKRGRRKVLVGINENYKLVMGMSVLTDGVYAGLCNLNGEILQRKFFEHKPEGRQGLLEVFVEAFEYLMRENCISESKLLGLGIAVSEDCDTVCGGEVSQELLARLKTELSHAVDVPIITCKLAEGLLLAERLFLSRVGQGAQSAVMLLVGKPAGIALFANGGLYRGGFNQAGGMSIIQATLSDFFELAKKEESKELLQLHDFLCFFDPKTVFVFGDKEGDLEANLPALWQKGKRAKRFEVLKSSLRRETIFLAGAADAATTWFYSV